MYAGVALTVVAMIVPYIDHATANVLADHIRDGYPTYSRRLAVASDGTAVAGPTAGQPPLQHEQPVRVDIHPGI